jgi:hypothetical protein
LNGGGLAGDITDVTNNITTSVSESLFPPVRWQGGREVGEGVCLGLCVCKGKKGGARGLCGPVRRQGEKRWGKGFVWACASARGKGGGARGLCGPVRRQGGREVGQGVSLLTRVGGWVAGGGCTCTRL